MARKALTKEQLEAKLKPFDDMYAAGYRWNVIYSKMNVTKQYVHKLRKKLAAFDEVDTSSQ